MKHTNKSFSTAAVSIALALGLQQKSVAATGPCDIYQSDSTPCVAAHSTVRALYGAYGGNLYQVRRASDNTTKNIPVLSAGGFVDVSVQDKFCTGTTCVISIIYDQTLNHNDLVKSPVAYWLTDGGNEANAADGKITVSGNTVHGIAVNAWSGIAYRNNATTNVATGNAAEAMYMVVDGQRHSGSCCFDYGNAEVNDTDDGNGTMEAIYWGTDVGWGGYRQGNGPWVAADLENGMFKGNAGYYGYGDTHKTPWPTSQSVVANYATAMLKGPSDSTFVLKAGDAQSGKLVTMWNDVRPTPGYSPKTLQGAIILGTGGDGSPGGEGTFFEGAMTKGVPSNATDDAIQANIVAAGYGSDAPIVTVPVHRDSVFNGGFDLGTQGWTFNVWGGGASGSVVNGEYEIQIDSIGQHNSSIQLVQNGIILEKGKSYQVKFDAYSSAKRTLEANVEQDVNPWTSYLLALQNFDLTTTKTTYSYTFAMTNPTDSNGRLSFNAGASTGNVFLDNVSIKAIPLGVHARVGTLVGGLRWSAEALQLPTTESGKLQIIDSRGRSRIVEVAAGRAVTGTLPAGIYQARFVGGKSYGVQRFTVLP